MKKLVCLVVCLLTLPAFGAINITTNGDNRTLTLQYTATAERVNTTLLHAAEWLYIKQVVVYYDGGGNVIPFENLTNQQRLGLIDAGVKKMLLQWSRSNIVNEAVETARETAEQEDTLIEE